MFLCVLFQNQKFSGGHDNRGSATFFQVSLDTRISASAKPFIKNIARHARKNF